LSNDPKVLEPQNSLTLEIATHWNALLCLDEADVFLRQRNLDHAHNSLVLVFLRKLEYYQGIMFLTTNRVRDFDEAIQRRIHLALKSPLLGVDTRREIWDNFLQRAATAHGAAVYSTLDSGPGTW
jgi:SpoVK/Ycf46/Vps4 family AAA+-type ATPase